MKNWYLSGDALINSINSLSLPDTCCALWPIGQVGFFFKYKATTILIDPVLTPVTDDNGVSCLHFEAPFSPEACFHVDAVFCTHDHLDHLNPETISRLAAAHPEAKFYIPKAVVPDRKDLFAFCSDRVLGLAQDETISISEDCSVTAVAAAHDHYDADENGNEKALGYVFHFGKISIFHAGDTLATDKLVSDVKNCGPITLSLLPINGRDWIREGRGIIGNMTPLEAALFAGMISSEMVIPTHYDMWKGNEESPSVFAHYMDLKCPDIAYHVPKLGEPFILTVQ